MILTTAPIIVAQDADAVTRDAFYAAVRTKNYTHAVEIGKDYAQRHLDDETFALNLAYAEIDAGDRDNAIQLLRHLASSTDTAIAAQASKQLDAMTSPGFQRSSLPPGYVYAYAANESRFGDNLLGFNARYDLARGAVVPSAALSGAYDTRSGTPGLAQVFNTDELFASAGLRAPLGQAQFGYLFAQGGYGFGLRGQPNAPETRYGLAYSRDYNTLFSNGPHSQIGLSVASYSRFSGNVIAYANALHDVRLTKSLRAIVGVNLAADSQRLYFNNYLEGFGGVAVPISATTSLRLVGVTGTYLGRGLNPPANTTYTSIRTLLVFGSGLP